MIYYSLLARAAIAPEVVVQLAVVLVVHTFSDPLID